MATLWKGFSVMKAFSNSTCLLRNNVAVLNKQFGTSSVFNLKGCPTSYCVRYTLLNNLRTVQSGNVNKFSNSSANKSLQKESVPERSVEEEEVKGTEIEKLDDVSIIKNIDKAVYNNDSRLFAVIQINGRQFKVTTEDILYVPLHFHPTSGDRIRLEKVLMVGGKDFTIIGRPLLSRDQVKIEATVVEKTLSHHKVHYWYRKRYRIRKFALKRQLQTMMVINSIQVNSITT